MRRFIFILLILFFCPNIQALTVKALDLGQMVALSNRICQVTTESSSLEEDRFESGYIVEYTTFQVHECLKGEVRKKLVIKQLARGLQGLPKYQEGQTYLLFLPPDSIETGLVAPVGIWQGLFTLVEKNGQWTVPGLKKSKRLRNDLRAEAKALSLNLPQLNLAGVEDYSVFRLVIQKMVEQE